MILVDTSSWVEMLRANGRAEVRDRVVASLESGQACWCAMVRLELWHGARVGAEQKALREFEQFIPELEITPEVWELACDLGRRARAKGITVPNPDLLIEAVGRHHKVPVEAADAHFAELAKL